MAQANGIGLSRVVYTDFTELVYANGSRKAILMPIIGHASKLICGWAIGESGNTMVAIRAWRRAKETFRRLRIPYAGMILRHDRDPVYAAYRWTSQLLLKDGLRLSYALGGAKDNPEIESFNGRFKTEGESLLSEVRTLEELRSVMDERTQYCNLERRHSSLNHASPLAFIGRTWSPAET